MRVQAILAAALLTAMAGSGRASSRPGAWTTFMRAREFTALLADTQQVWGATAEAGLVRFDRARQSLELIRREPGTIASNHLTALARDRAGRLWVGSEGSGVSRRSADGRRWDLVNLLDGLPSDSVRTLEATGDTVWIGTTRGLALWNGRQVSGSLPDGITASFDTTFHNATVTGIALTGDSLWISTRRGIGLARISLQLSDWRPVNDGLSNTDVRALAWDGADLFAHAATDVYRWRADLGQWTLEPGAGTVHRLVDAAGVVLATGESGAFRWSHTPADSSWSALVGAPVASPSQAEDPEITIDEHGKAFATLGETLYDASSPPAWAPHPLPDGPPSNVLVQLGIDRSRVYVTSDVDGVARYDGQWRYWPGVSCSGPECDTTFWRPLYVNGWFVDRTGRKWAGCWSQAIDSFRDDGAVPQFTHHLVVTDLNSERRSWFVCAAEDSSGAVWLGMDTPLRGVVDPIGVEVYGASGVFLRNFNQSNTPGMSGNLVHGITSTGKGTRVWIGYDSGGLDFVVPPDTAFIHVNSTNGQAVRALASYGDSVWMLTTTQAWLFKSTAAVNSQPTKRINLYAAIPQLGPRPLAVANDGTLWVGTTEGARLFHPGGAADSFTIANSPIPDDEVRAIAVDPSTGAVWMTTTGGLARFDPFYAPPPPPPLPVLRARVYPNPALLTGLGIQLRIDGDAESYTGEVYDIGGRRLARFHGATNGVVVWNGRDDDGALVPPGVYFLRVQAQGRSAVARVVLLR
jgi:hypothetical protein